jgi:hypothetical protein
VQFTGVNAEPPESGLTHEAQNAMLTGFFEGSGKKFFAKIC